MKFGGTSVANVERIRSVALRVKREVDSGRQVAVVVSAMSGKTNELVAWVQDASKAPGSNFNIYDAREYDAVVASGEQVTSGLLAIALQAIGLKARSWQGWQIPLTTDTAHGSARIAGIDGSDMLRSFAEEGEVAVVAARAEAVEEAAQREHVSPRAIWRNIGKLAKDLSLMGQFEVAEVAEPTEAGRGGSSAMPHKRNPVLTENLTGLARMVRSAVTPALENVALWHERDISHSSVERFIGPDATITLDFALARLTSVVDKLVVYPERMQKNLDKMGGLVHSQRVLLALTQAGLERDTAYRLVQRNAMKVWESDGQLNLLELPKADPEVTAALSPAELDEKFNLNYHFKAIDTIFTRVFGE